MKPFTLADWAHVAEIIASIVIVISLGYVGLEINQNTKALQNESHRSTLEMMNSGQNILATDEQFHRIYVLGLESPTELNESEWSRFVQFMLPRIGAWEYLFLAKLEGSVSVGAWAAFDPYFREIVCMPGLIKFMADYESSYAPDFIEYVKSGPIRQCGDG